MPFAIARVACATIFVGMVFDRPARLARINEFMVAYGAQLANAQTKVIPLAKAAPEHSPRLQSATLDLPSIYRSPRPAGRIIAV